MEVNLRRIGAAVRRGGECDRWALQVQSGLLGGAWLLMEVEEHRGGNQLVRVRCWPWWRRNACVALAVCAGRAVASAVAHAGAAAALLSVTALALSACMLIESSVSTATILHVVDQTRDDSA